MAVVNAIVGVRIMKIIAANFLDQTAQRYAADALNRDFKKIFRFSIQTAVNFVDRLLLRRRLLKCDERIEAVNKV